MKNYWKSFLAAFLFSFSRFPHFGFLIFFAFLPLFSMFNENLSKRKTIISALVFSSIYTAVALHWIALATVGYYGLFLLFGAYFVILFLLINKFWQTSGFLKFWVLLTFWVSFEFIQNFGEFRFPWFNVGYALAEYNPLIQVAEFGGIYILSIGTILTNIFIFNWKKRHFRFLGIIIFSVWILSGILQFNLINLTKTDTNIAIIQPSIKQDLKWEKNFEDSIFSRLQTLSKKAMRTNPSMLIWPESALPGYLRRDRKLKNFTTNIAKKNSVQIFTGFPDYKIAQPPFPNRYKFYNAATKIDQKGNFSKIYHKNILVPFGERTPFLKTFPVLWKVQFGQANFEYGDNIEFYELEKYKFAPLICFEIAMPSLTNKIAQSNADFIVNLTNDAWFKKSVGTFQHAMMTKIRAVETRTQIYRAANTGFSLVISPKGEILQKSKLYDITTLSKNLFIHDGKTFFTKFPLLFPFLCLIIGFYLVIFRWRK